MTTDTAPPFEPFIDSFPWMREAVATADIPAPWDASDVPAVLSAIEELATWLGPFLPRPEVVALASPALQGQERDELAGLTYSTPQELLRDIRILISYLAMIGAGLEVLTSDE